MSAPVASQLVVFGLTGDLARKKLIPALYELAARDLLPEHTQIIGVTRRSVTVASVLAFMHNNPNYDAAVLKRLEKAVEMFQMDLTSPADYAKLKHLLDNQEKTTGVCFNRLFYLSMPAQVFGPVIDLLGSSSLTIGCTHGPGSGASRLLIEKPFGYDLASAEELVKRLAAAFNDEQIFRIDHYVAKETSQNILTFRFHNPIFQAAWDARHVERITVTASEILGLEGRAAFYEQTGALRDLIQNHLLQLLALVTMENPAKLEADAIHAAKLKLLEAIQTIAPDKVTSETVRGQYLGYREEADKPASHTETFAAVRLNIDNDRWRGVPIVLQTGKLLDKKITEIILTFKGENELRIRVEPDEGICLKVLVKTPGLGSSIEAADMDFRYDRSFTERQPDAYERVLMDAMRGDRSLFTTSAETLESWRIVEPVVQEWAKTDMGLVSYEPGTPVAKLSAPLFS